MHEAKDFRLQKKQMNELTLTSMQSNHLCHSASSQCRTPIIFLKVVNYPPSPTSFFGLKAKAPLPTLKQYHLSTLLRGPGSDRLVLFVVLPCYCAQEPGLLLLQRGVGLFLPRRDWLQLKRRLGAL